ncbi:S9 family peptidase [Horticoccus sp. 23ND18S-11]|uniref:S9 family peptidase n=1 Tax=Horticoccus sp. 23ND18S-11 TaxID=3391832 RepID=UPI0039C9391A
MCPSFRALWLCALAAAFSVVGAESRSTPPTDLITATDLLQIRQLAAPAFSPDGKWIAYTVRDVVEKPGPAGDLTYRTQLWLVAADGRTAPRQLTFGEPVTAGPQWSPDGRRIAFTRGEPGKAQLWILPLVEGGEAFVLTKLDQAVANPRWSPDGRMLAFTLALNASEVGAALEKNSGTAAPIAWDLERPNRKPGDTTDWFKKDPNRKAGANATPRINQADGTLAERRDWLAKNEAEGSPRVITRLNFLGEGDLEPQLKFTNLYVIEAREGAEPRALAPDYESVGGTPGSLDGGSAPAWSADAKWIVVTGRFATPQQEHPDRMRANDLLRISVDGRSRERLDTPAGYVTSSPIVSPDGNAIAFLASEVAKESFAQTRIGRWTTDGKPARLLGLSIDRSVSQLRWSADGASLWFVAASRGDFPLHRVAATGGDVTVFTSAGTGVTAFDLTRDRIAYVRVSPASPGEIVVSAIARHEPAPVTTHNQVWLQGKRLATMEPREIVRPDGVKIDVWLMRPPGFEAGKRYPLLLEIHGGPSAMWGPGEPSMWHEFQFFAARGYAIVFSNPRGSGGYGYEFQRGNYQNWGPGPGADVLAAADLAAAEPWVDASRAVVTGGSYGGYLTAWILTQDQRFKAAVAQRGVYDLITFFGEGNAWRLVPYHFGGYPWEAETRRILDANSPFLRVAAITTPLLIQHGDNDLRTGVRQGEMLYKALKVLGRPVEYARYPRATHELSRSGEPRQRVDTLVRYEEFFRRFIGD